MLLVCFINTNCTAGSANRPSAFLILLLHMCLDCTAGITDTTVGGHLPWDGLSFTNLLASGNAAPEAAAMRGASLANKKQQERVLFTLVPHCWDADAVPELDANR
jgi:hypothetical protein